MSQSLLKKIITEPLVHFLVIALLFFVIYDTLNPQIFDESKIINVSSNRIDQLQKGFKKTWSRAPNEKELKKMISNYAFDEIYAREAKALGLSENDEVIRRRLRQKMEFILQDMSILHTPTEQELNDFYQQNIDKYRQDDQYTFEQVYIMTNRSETEIEQKITEQMQRIEQGEKPQGDTSMLPSKITNILAHQANRQFGVGFSYALNDAPINQWVGPVKSGLGLHFIKVTQHFQGNAPVLSDIKSVVLKDWRYQQNKLFVEDYQTNLLTQYQINIDDYSLTEDKKVSNENTMTKATN